MIVWHEQLSKTTDLFKAVMNTLFKEDINIDGVVNYFKYNNEQGLVLKIYDKYNPNLDLVIWAYISSNRKVNNEFTIKIGKHIDCDNENIWIDNNVESFTFTNSKTREMHKETRDFIIDTIKNSFDKSLDYKSI